MKWPSYSISAILALRLIELTGPSGNVIEVNPSEIVTMREPYKTEHYGADVNCIIYTTDGKLAGVKERCEAIKNMINEDP